MYRRKTAAPSLGSPPKAHAAPSGNTVPGEQAHQSSHNGACTTLATLAFPCSCRRCSSSALAGRPTRGVTDRLYSSPRRIRVGFYLRDVSHARKPRILQHPQIGWRRTSELHSDARAHSRRGSRQPRFCVNLLERYIRHSLRVQLGGIHTFLPLSTPNEVGIMGWLRYGGLSREIRLHVVRDRRDGSVYATAHGVCLNWQTLWKDRTG